MASGLEMVAPVVENPEVVESVLSGSGTLLEGLSGGEVLAAGQSEGVLSSSEALFERLSDGESPLMEKAESVRSGSEALFKRLSRERAYTFMRPDDCGKVRELLTPVEKQDREIEAVENGEKVLDTTQKKGNYGEMKTDQDLRNHGYEKISTDVVTSVDDPGHHGIDGIYHNPDGEPPYIIVDAKYDTAQLNTKVTDGPQMSQSWIDARLDDAVGKEKADEIRLAMLEGDVGGYVAHVAKGGDLNAPVTYDKVDENGIVVEKDVKINAT